MSYTDAQRARFWSKTRRLPNGCLEWTGTQSGGRGKLTIAKRVRWASRVAYEMSHGTIPVGLWVLHHCDNGLCVEPIHLYPGTPRDNMRDLSQREGRRRILTMQQARAIRTAAAAGSTRRALAAKYGVAKRSIDMIVNNRTYLEMN